MRARMPCRAVFGRVDMFVEWTKRPAIPANWCVRFGALCAYERACAMIVDSCSGRAGVQEKCNANGATRRGGVSPPGD